MTLSNLTKAGWVNEDGKPGLVNPFDEVLRNPDPVELALALEAQEISPEHARSRAAQLKAAQSFAPRRLEHVPTFVAGQVVKLDGEGREKASFAIKFDNGGYWGIPRLNLETRNLLLSAKTLGRGVFNASEGKFESLEIDGNAVDLAGSPDMSP